ncbi:MAG: hypothetical protein H6Q84_1332, partial [Deltaproteobacteria bacterium]|nr:hypothetical protein [Deltaproteobacteria bacterium]
MIRLRTLKLFLGLVTIAMLAIGCGGGGEASQSTPSSTVALLSWTPPETTSDNTAIDPYEELDHYEIYVSVDGKFSEDDIPVALVTAVADLPSQDGQNFSKKALVTEFDLNLIRELPAANAIYVSLRAVGTDR